MPIDFYDTGQPYDILSNVTSIPVKIWINGHEYNALSSEAIFQGMKGITSQDKHDQAEGIKLVNDTNPPGGRLQKKGGKPIAEGGVYNNFNQLYDTPFPVTGITDLKVKEQVMYEILLAKATQNPEILKALLNTQNEYITERTSRANYDDNFWGDGRPTGRPYPGLNALGKAWMRVRETLRQELTTHQSVRVRTGFSLELANTLRLRGDLHQYRDDNRVITKSTLDRTTPTTTVAAFLALPRNRRDVTTAAEPRTVPVVAAVSAPPILTTPIPISKQAPELEKFKAGCLQGAFLRVFEAFSKEYEMNWKECYDETTGRLISLELPTLPDEELIKTYISILEEAFPGCVERSAREEFKIILLADRFPGLAEAKTHREILDLTDKLKNKAGEVSMHHTPKHLTRDFKHSIAANAATAPLTAAPFTTASVRRPPHRQSDSRMSVAPHSPTRSTATTTSAVPATTAPATTAVSATPASSTRVDAAPPATRAAATSDASARTATSATSAAASATPVVAASPASAKTAASMPSGSNDRYLPAYTKYVEWAQDPNLLKGNCDTLENYQATTKAAVAAFENKKITNTKVIHDESTGNIELMNLANSQSPERIMSTQYRNNEVEIALSDKSTDEQIFAALILNKGFAPLDIETCDSLHFAMRLYEAAKIVGMEVNLSGKNKTDLAKPENEALKKLYDDLQKPETIQKLKTQSDRVLGNPVVSDSRPSR